MNQKNNKPIWELGGEATRKRFAGTDHFQKIGRKGWAARKKNEKNRAVEKSKNP